MNQLLLIALATATCAVTLYWFLFVHYTEQSRIVALRDILQNILKQDWQAIYLQYVSLTGTHLLENFFQVGPKRLKYWILKGSRLSKEERIFFTASGLELRVMFDDGCVCELSLNGHEVRQPAQNLGRGSPVLLVQILSAVRQLQKIKEGQRIAI